MSRRPPRYLPPSASVTRETSTPMDRATSSPSAMAGVGAAARKYHRHRQQEKGSAIATWIIERSSNDPISPEDDFHDGIRVRRDADDKGHGRTGKAADPDARQQQRQNILPASNGEKRSIPSQDSGSDGGNGEKNGICSGDASIRNRNRAQGCGLRRAENGGLSARGCASAPVWLRPTSPVQRQRKAKAACAAGGFHEGQWRRLHHFR